MAFFAIRRGILRSLSIPTVASVAGHFPRDRSETRCMITAPAVPTCGARCLFPLKDPRCSSPCDRPLGHLRTHLCACNPHLLDAAAPPAISASVDSFDKVISAMEKKGFSPEQARTLWKQGYRQANAIENLSCMHIARMLTPTSSSLATSSSTTSTGVTPLRADHPVLRPSLRGSRQDMFLAISSEEGRKKALEQIEELTETANSRRTNESLWNSWSEILAAWGQPPLPLNPAKVKMVAASLRAGRYRNAEPYFHRARVQHLRTLEQAPDAATLDAMKRYARAVARGVGPSKLKDALPLEMLTDITKPPEVDKVKALPQNACAWPAAMFILGSWWLTRGIEASAAKVKHIAFGSGSEWTVSWTLPASKTDVKALGATRTHRCICAEGGGVRYGTISAIPFALIT